MDYHRLMLKSKRKKREALEWAEKENLPHPLFAAQCFAGLRSKGKRPPTAQEVVARMEMEWPVLFREDLDAEP